MEPFSVELEQNDLYMDFEDFMEDDEAEGGDEGEESTNEDDDESWEDVSSTSDDDGEIGEQGVVDPVEVPPAAGGEVNEESVAPGVPQPYLHEPLPRDGVVNHGDAHRQNVERQ